MALTRESTSGAFGEQPGGTAAMLRPLLGTPVQEADRAPSTASLTRLVWPFHVACTLVGVARRYARE